jgi:hypothetical protein
MLTTLSGSFKIRNGLIVGNNVLKVNITSNNPSLILANNATITVGGVAGTNGQILTSNGSGVYWASTNSTAITLGNSSVYATINSTSINSSSYYVISSAPGYDVAINAGNGHLSHFRQSGVLELNGAIIGSSYGSNYVDVSNIGSLKLGGELYGVSVRTSPDRATYYDWSFGTDGKLTLAGSIVLPNNNKLQFTPTSGSANAYFIMQNDDNFVFYTTAANGASRPVFSIYANTATGTQGGAFKFNTAIDINGQGIWANGSIGTSGQVLTSNGTSANWSKSVRSGTNGETTSGNITPTSDASDHYTVIGLTGSITMLAPSGSPADGQRLMLRIKDNGTARAITWTTSAGGYRVIGVTLPTTTSINKNIYINCIYNSTDGYWDVIQVSQQA